MKKNKKKSNSKKFINNCGLIIIIISSVILVSLAGLALQLFNTNQVSWSIEEPFVKSFVTSCNEYFHEDNSGLDNEDSVEVNLIEESIDNEETIVSSDENGEAVSADAGLDEVIQEGLEEQADEENQEEEASDSDPSAFPGRMIRPREYETITAWTARSPYYDDGDQRPITTSYPYITVDNSYYDDALFIGDSRVEGLHDYGGLDNATFAYKTGLSVFNIWDEDLRVAQGENSHSMSLENLLSTGTYKKIFLMIGVNELGKGYSYQYVEKYIDIVNSIREHDPTAVIILMGTMYVTKTYSDGSDVFNNDNINCRNTAVVNALPEDDGIFYLDMNECVADPNTGVLMADYTNDGLHLKAQYYYLWVDFLNVHGLSEEIFLEN